MRAVVMAGLVTLVVSLAGCAAEQGDQQEFTRTDAEAIRNSTMELMNAFNAKDLDRILSLHSDESVFMPPNSPILRGREPLRSFYGDLTQRATDLRIESEEVAGFGPFAYNLGTYSLVYEDGAVRDRGKYLFILRETGGTWRLEKTMWSSDLPPRDLKGDR